jgi:quercetin dioxygenase-like cupin family protein
MEHRRNDDVEWVEAPAQHFTGAVRFGPHADDRGHEADINVLGVEFQAGARTDWHTHPGGQVIYVVEGDARVGVDGGPVIEAGPGDAVWSPPGELHWHGAGPDGTMTHLSITHLGATEWTDRKVTDEEYGG